MTKLNTSLSHSALFIIFTGLIYQVITMISTVILARWLLSEDLGTYRQLGLINGILSPLFACGIPASVLYFFPNMKSDYERQEFITQTFYMLIVSSFLLCGILIAFSKYISLYFNNNKIYKFMFVYSVIIFVSMSTSYFYMAMIALKKMKYATLITMLFGTIIVLFQIIAAYLKPELSSVLYAFLIGSIIQFLGITIIVNKLVGFIHPKILSINKCISQLKYSYPLALSAFIGTIGYQIDQLIVGRYFDPVMFAIYVIGAVEIPIISQIQGASNSVLTPEISIKYNNNEPTEIFKLWHSSIRKISLIVFPAFVYFFIVSDVFITFLYSDKYINSVPIFRIYLLLMPLRITTYSLIVTATGNTKYNVNGSIIYVTLNLLFNVILVRYLNIYGPAVATVISTYILSYYYLSIMKKIFKYNITDIFPFWSIVRQLIITISVAIIFIPLYFINLTGIYKLMVYGMVYSSAYIIVLYRFGYIYKEDLTIVKEWISGQAIKYI